MADSKAGALFIVATPIGNMADITYRAVKTLTEVDLILAEDTRESRKLCTHYGIRTPMQSFHDHNEAAQTPTILEKLLAGYQVALISDAGTPLVSDPGYKLVKAAQTIGVQAQTVPGASALVAALSIAGLPTDQFTFAGFLPAKNKARKDRLTALLGKAETIVCYESKHRMLACLEDLHELAPTREIVVARELTKRFETILRGTAATIRTEMMDHPQQQKGEFVLLFSGIVGAGSAKVSADVLLNILLPEVSVKVAARIASELSGKNKNALYQRALELIKLNPEQ